MAGDEEIRITLRLPSSLRDLLTRRASEGARSMNGEITHRLQSFDDQVKAVEELSRKYDETNEKLQRAYGLIQRLSTKVNELTNLAAEREREEKPDGPADKQEARTEDLLMQLSDLAENLRKMQERADAERQWLFGLVESVADGEITGARLDLLKPLFPRRNKKIKALYDEYKRAKEAGNSELEATAKAKIEEISPRFFMPLAEKLANPLYPDEDEK